MSATGCPRNCRKGGTITIEQDDVDVDAQSTLRLTQTVPPRYELREITTFAMTIDGAGEDGPLVLGTRNPMVLIGQLTQYPPKGDLYRLENPVELVELKDREDSTAKPVAVIEQFPVKVGGL
ncbi:hypothetical protein [Stackebrandtia soli]|uniref:hypothetical protein n=1 Tax=Stackebrandtia soli TaxID=1892856 RepID=UPI0039E7B25F